MNDTRRLRCSINRFPKMQYFQFTFKFVIQDGENGRARILYFDWFSIPRLQLTRHFLKKINVKIFQLIQCYNAIISVLFLVIFFLRKLVFSAQFQCCNLKYWRNSKSKKKESCRCIGAIFHGIISQNFSSKFSTM